MSLSFVGRFNEWNSSFVTLQSASEADCRVEAIMLPMSSLVYSGSCLRGARTDSTLDRISSVGMCLGVTIFFKSVGEYMRFTNLLICYLRKNCSKSFSTLSRTLQTSTIQETVMHCVSFIVQPIYLHLRARPLSLSNHAFSNGYSIYWLIKLLTRVFEFWTD